MKKKTIPHKCGTAFLEKLYNFKEQIISKLTNVYCPATKVASNACLTVI